VVATQCAGGTVTTSQASVPILTVDDNATKLFALRSVLSPLGYNIVEAGSGIEALRCVMAQNFAVILLDVLMPVMDGFETAALIRQRQQSEMTPIIFITAHTKDEVAHSDHYAQGAVDFIYAPIPPEELRAKVSVFANLYTHAAELAAKALAIQTSVDQLEELNVELTAIARRDPLTGLRNRRALSEDLEVLEARVSRYGHRYCMAVLDVDHFKSYNDAYGHQAGDHVLQTVGEKLTALLRSGDSLYRFGGEEFLCIFTEQSLESGRQAVERMRVGIEELAIPHSGTPHGVLTCSGGVAILDADRRRSASQVLKEADEALYRAKHLGRNRVEFADLEAMRNVRADAVLNEAEAALNGAVPAQGGIAPEPRPAAT
jgi:diguanylate cyclase (GGDEF)-like protein